MRSRSGCAACCRCLGSASGRSPGRSACGRSRRGLRAHRSRGSGSGSRRRCCRDSRCMNRERPEMSISWLTCARCESTKSIAMGGCWRATALMIPALVVLPGSSVSGEVERAARERLVLRGAEQLVERGALDRARCRLALWRGARPTSPASALRAITPSHVGLSEPGIALGSVCHAVNRRFASARTRGSLNLPERRDQRRAKQRVGRGLAASCGAKPSCWSRGP